MKVFLFVSKQKKLYKMYMPYLDALNKQLDIVKQMAVADIVLIVGAWTIKGAQLLAKRERWAFHTSCVLSVIYPSEIARTLTSSEVCKPLCIRRRCIRRQTS